MKRLLSLLFAVVLALLSGAVPASPTVSEQVGERIGSVVYDLAHKDEFSPFEQKTGPPSLALSTTQHARPRWGISGLGNSSNNGCCASFVANLQYTLVPDFSLGSGTPTFTRATTAYQTDFAGTLNAVLSGEARFQGARRVANLYASSATFATTTNTTIAGTYTVSFTGTGTITFSGTNSGSLVGQGAATRVAKTITTTAGTLTSTVTGTVTNAQLENVTGQANQNPSEYVDSATAYGAGVNSVRYFPYLNGNTVSSNIVTQATGAAINSSQSACAGGVTAGVVDAIGPYGYLAEGARTNLLLYSNDRTNADWTNTNITAAANTTVAAPDGTLTGTLLTASAGNGTSAQSITGTAASYTHAVYLLRKTGIGTINISANGGTNYTACTINITTWTRCTDTRTLTAAGYNQVIQIVTNGDAVYAWESTAELGAFASSVIGPTTTVAVMRNADVLSYSATSNVGNTGTAYAEFSLNGENGSNTVGIITLGATGTTYPLGLSAAPRLTIYDGTNSASFGTGFSLNTIVKGASSWGGSTISVVQNGGTIATGTYSGTMSGTTIQVGQWGATGQLFGTIRNVVIWPVALSSPYLIMKTTDATDWLDPQNWMLAANDDIFRKAANQ